MSDANMYRAALHFDRALKVGDIVEARWTNSHMEYRAKAEVIRVNGKSVRVRIMEAVKDYKGVDVYSVGHAIVCPRIMAQDRFSMSNCVCPLDNPEAAGPKYKRGEIVDGKGKVLRIFVNYAGYSYDFEPIDAGAQV
jgi:hypothetical protein